MRSTTSKGYDIYNDEICRVLNNVNNSSEDIKIQVLKLMPLINSIEISESSEVLDNTCFINSNYCKPNPSRQVKTQNFITASKFVNHKIKTIKQGSVFLCKLLNKRTDRIYITDNLITGEATFNGGGDLDVTVPDNFQELFDELVNLQLFFNEAIANNTFQGKSAYQSYLDTTTDNPPLSEELWASSNKTDGLKKSVDQITELLSGVAPADGAKIKLDTINTVVTDKFKDLFIPENIDTDTTKITSQNGLLTIIGDDFAITDKGKMVRFETGTDPKNGFYFTLRDDKGNILLDKDGLKPDFIPSGTITPAMLSPNFDLSNINMGGESIGSIITELQKKDTFNMEIVNLNGSAIQMSTPELNLDVHIFNSEFRDVTDIYEDSQFKWVRQSSNSELDDIWNGQDHVGKFITITAADLYKTCDFRCTLVVNDTIIATTATQILDLTDLGTIALHITSNHPTTQIKNPNTAPPSYTPDWSIDKLILTPVAIMSGDTIDLTSPQVGVEWFRKVGVYDEAPLITGEIVKNGILSVDKNVLDNEGFLTYVCHITYTDKAINKVINATASQSFTLIGQSESSKFCSISGDSFVLMDSDRNVKYPQNGIIELNAVTTNVTIKNWQYKNADGVFIDMVPAHTSHTLRIDANSNLFFNDTAVFKLVTSYDGATDIHSVTRVQDGAQGLAPAIAILDNESCTIPSNSNGLITSLSGAETRLTIFENNIDCTSSWNISITPSKGITGEQSLDKRSFTITNMTEDLGNVVFRATKDGYGVLTKTFTVAKNRNGADGRIFAISANTLALNKTTTGVFLPSNVVFSAYYRNGTTALRNPYKGILVISETTDSGSKVEKYRSPEPEVSVAYTPSSLLISTIICELYSTDGSELLDTQTTVITSDGSHGISIMLGNEFTGIPCTSSGVVSPSMDIEIPFTVFQGIERLEATATVQNLPTGMSILSSTPASQTTDGVLTIHVENGATLGDLMNGDLTIRVTAGGAVFIRTFSWMKILAAVDGVDAILHEIIAPKGNVLYGNIAEITLQSIVYCGINELTEGLTYKWFKYETTKWVLLDSSNSSLTVTRDMVSNSATFKCEVTFDGNIYKAIYSVFDKQDLYSAEIISTVGNQILNDECEGVLYTRLYKNGEEQDPIQSNDFVYRLPTLAKVGERKYLINRSDKTIKLFVFTTDWEEIPIENQYEYTYTRRAYDGEIIDTEAWQSGKFLYFTGADLPSRSTTVTVSVADISAFITFAKTYDISFQDKCTGHEGLYIISDHTDNSAICINELRGNEDFAEDGFTIKTISGNLFDKNNTQTINGSLYTNFIPIFPNTQYFNSHSKKWLIYDSNFNKIEEVLTGNILDGYINDTDSLVYATLPVSKEQLNTFWVSDKILTTYVEHNYSELTIDIPLRRLGDVYDSFIMDSDLSNFYVTKRISDGNSVLSSPLRIDIPTVNFLKSFKGKTFIYVVDKNNIAPSYMSISCKSESWFNYYEMERKYANLEDVVMGSVEDSIIDTSERYIIKERLKRLELDMSDVDSSYQSIIINEYLYEGAERTNLIEMYSGYMTSYNDFINLMNTILGKPVITDTDKRDIESAYSNYNNCLYKWSQSLQEALDFISKNRMNASLLFTIELSNDSQLVPATSDGNVITFLGCETQVTVKLGAIDITNSVDITFVESKGVKGTWDNSTKCYTVTNLTDDTAYVDFYTNYNDEQFATKRFSISKSRQGDMGVSPKTLSLDATTLIVPFNSDNTPKNFTPIKLLATQQNFNSLVRWETTPDVILNNTVDTNVKELPVDCFMNVDSVTVTITADDLISRVTIVKIYDGQEGNGVASTITYYYISTSPIELENGEWTTDTTTWENGKYIWYKTVTTYTNNNTHTTKPVCITGSSGKGISEFFREYTLSDSKDVIPSQGDNWTTTLPEWRKGVYVWVRIRIVYDDSTEEIATPYCDTSWEVVNNVQDQIDDINSNKMLRLEICSTNGNIFKNGHIQTTLYAKVYSWDTDITNELDDAQFKWTRVSSEPESDDIWNIENAKGVKQIQVTSDDVRGRATFYCDLLDLTTNKSLIEHQ